MPTDPPIAPNGHPGIHLWGQSTTLHVDGETELVRCAGYAGGASSLHLHRRKFNTFMLVSGKMRLSIEETDVIMSGGDSFTVRPGVRHRMAFVTDALLFELYAAIPGGSIEPGDIVRFDEGRKP
jgi:mannose-6-phosphate isomerase-like protein (cupin superfamily)